MSGSVLLIITGGIGAYKALDLIRQLKACEVSVYPVMTDAASRFITPLSVGALAEETVHMDLFDLTEETEMGHIALSRRADLVVVAPASADFLSRMAAGCANDLATTLLLATDAPVLVAPAMNVRMWEHPATQRGVRQLRADGIHFVGPDTGLMACGDTGPGRLAEIPRIVSTIQSLLRTGPSSTQLPDLSGVSALITSGPTREPIDPVRFLSNHSSGTQGYAIANALVQRGANVTLITGPLSNLMPLSARVHVIPVETAQEMHAAVMSHLPTDVVVCAAAVSDWRVATPSKTKWKKDGPGAVQITLVENPDILKDVAHHQTDRPPLVIGFAVETDDLERRAQIKRRHKGCDWLLANGTTPESAAFGETENTIYFINETHCEWWPKQSKSGIADQLADQISLFFQQTRKG